jgi:hypothetical protein
LHATSADLTLHNINYGFEFHNKRLYLSQYLSFLSTPQEKEPWFATLFTPAIDGISILPVFIRAISNIKRLLHYSSVLVKVQSG